MQQQQFGEKLESVVNEMFDKVKTTTRKLAKKKLTESQKKEK